MKTYLEPQNSRRGLPILYFIDKDRYGYWLGVYHELTSLRTPIFGHLSKRPYLGAGNEYNAVDRTRITKETYQALLKEAKRNHARYKIQKT